MTINLLIGELEQGRRKKIFQGKGPTKKEKNRKIAKKKTENSTITLLPGGGAAKIKT